MLDTHGLAMCRRAKHPTRPGLQSRGRASTTTRERCCWRAVSIQGWVKASAELSSRETRVSVDFRGDAMGNGALATLPRMPHSSQSVATPSPSLRPRTFAFNLVSSELVDLRVVLTPAQPIHERNESQGRLLRHNLKGTTGACLAVSQYLYIILWPA